MKQHRLAIGYNIGGFEYNGFQLSYLYGGEKNHFHIYTKQFNAGIPSLSYGLHIGIGIKRLFSINK